jgi:hypothetical protein
MKAVAFLVATLVASTTARADDGQCAALVCDDRTAHPGTYSCDTPPCYCNDSCGGGAGGGSTGNTNGDAMARGMAKLIGYTVLGVAFLFMPGHMGQWTSDGPRQSAKDAHKDWDDYDAKRKRLVQAGKDAEKSAAAYWKLDEEERAQLRDAPAAKKKVLKPFNPPKLKPDLHWQCDQAKLLMPSTHTHGPIGAFTNEGDMVGKCSQFTEPPVDYNNTCATTDVQCGLVNAANAAICCPRTHPIYNPCSEKCYRTTDFIAGPDTGLHCATSRDCASFNPQ